MKSEIVGPGREEEGWRLVLVRAGICFLLQMS